MRKGDEVQYRTIPVFHGIYEFNLKKLNLNWLGGLFGHILAGGLGQKVYETDTPFYRTIPVKSGLNSTSEILPYDDAEAIINRKETVAVAKCVCRAAQVELNNDCGHPLETCLVFDDYAKYYVENGISRLITKEEALDIIKTGEKEGRITQVANSQDPEVMCSCCPCSCGIFIVLKMFGGTSEEVVSNYYSQVSVDLCAGDCHEVCQGRCLTEALQLAQGKIETNVSNCLGCGLCVNSCPNGAISLVRKPQDKLYHPPATLFAAYEKMEEYRKVK
ncbi:MAG: ferredoxin family protein [Peptococcaceae bacterium]|nr:ferredoxin family protein [Peptococcaceae bacterium]